MMSLARTQRDFDSHCAARETPYQPEVALESSLGQRSLGCPQSERYLQTRPELE